MKISTRTYMSLHHIQAAALFSRKASVIEAAFDGTYNAGALADHRSFVVGAVMSATAFLEAGINELFADASEHTDSHFKGVDQDIGAVMAAMWSLGIPRTARYRVLEKYEIALALARRSPFDRGIRPYQDVDALICLRNTLVHYEPEWIPSDATRAEYEVHHLEKVLRSRFPLNPLMAGGNPFWPDKCLSRGCATWAVESALQFTADFFGRLGVSPLPYEHVRERLATIEVA